MDSHEDKIRTSIVNNSSNRREDTTSVRIDRKSRPEDETRVERKIEGTTRVRTDHKSRLEDETRAESKIKDETFLRNKITDQFEVVVSMGGDSVERGGRKRQRQVSSTRHIILIDMSLFNFQ
ncbi:uncharacterized protein LOC107043554 [Diachasma alloeum]|uniref:uncharacterized protein LOC107043554 n=1 Tax=Diachasma alloeum TaxID=454923 RepID=UPI0007383604|nr:uncharacterized protein LOC107043554 [Diachasma alloeum]